MADASAQNIVSFMSSGLRMRLVTNVSNGCPETTSTMRPSRLKPILVHPGIGELLALHRADALASGRPTTAVEFCERVLRETPADVLHPPPLLTGDDLIALGWEQGPLFKRVLDAVREAQLEGTIRTKEEAIRLAEELRNRDKDK